jgi:hypothetical protein
MAIHGAALHARVAKQLREELTAYGLPMREYKCTVAGYYEHDPELLLYAEFTRGDCAIEINDIYTSKETGDVLQRGRPELS